jgi:hypothetical protein
VVEVDLLLRGQRTQLARPLPEGRYYAMIFRADARPNVNVIAWGLADPLPEVPVPLRAATPDVRLDLAGVFGAVYERVRFERKLAYDRLPNLPAADVAWVDGRMQHT